MKHDSLWPVIRRRAWVPALFVCIALAVAAINTLRSPQYQATATVVARQQTPNNGQTLDFTDIATSNIVAIRALHDAGANESVQELQNQLSVVASRSDLYRVSVGDATADRAVALANAVASEAAVLFEALGGGAATSVVTDLERDRIQYRDQYLAAAQSLATFESAHPETLALASTHALTASSSESSAASSAAAAQYRDQYLAATQALVTFEGIHPETAKGNATPALAAQRQQLQLDQQAAANAFLSLQTAAAQEHVAQVSTPPAVAPDLVTQWQQLQLDQQAAASAYLGLQTAAAQARVAQVNAANEFTATVVDQAVAKSTSTGRILKLAYTGTLGLTFGIALAVVLEYVTSSRRRAEAAPVHPRRSVEKSRPAGSSPETAGGLVS